MRAAQRIFGRIARLLLWLRIGRPARAQAQAQGQALSRRSRTCCKAVRRDGRVTLQRRCWRRMATGDGPLTIESRSDCREHVRSVDMVSGDEPGQKILHFDLGTRAGRARSHRSAAGSQNIVAIEPDVDGPYWSGTAEGEREKSPPARYS